jgi:hypothetical protein
MCKQLAYLTGSTTLSFFHHEILLFDLEVFLNAKNILWKARQCVFEEETKSQNWNENMIFSATWKASKNHCKVYAGGDHTCFSFIFDSAVKEARNWMMAMYRNIVSQ